MSGRERISKPRGASAKLRGGKSRGVARAPIPQQLQYPAYDGYGGEYGGFVNMPPYGMQSHRGHAQRPPPPDLASLSSFPPPPRRVVPHIVPHHMAQHFAGHPLPASEEEDFYDDCDASVEGFASGEGSVEMIITPSGEFPKMIEAFRAAVSKNQELYTRLRQAFESNGRSKQEYEDAVENLMKQHKEAVENLEKQHKLAVGSLEKKIRDLSLQNLELERQLDDLRASMAIVDATAEHAEKRATVAEQRATAAEQRAEVAEEAIKKLERKWEQEETLRHQRSVVGDLAYSFVNKMKEKVVAIASERSSIRTLKDLVTHFPVDDPARDAVTLEVISRLGVRSLRHAYRHMGDCTSGRFADAHHGFSGKVTLEEVRGIIEAFPCDEETRDFLNHLLAALQTLGGDLFQKEPAKAGAAGSGSV